MPIYEYQCRKCGHRFERIQKFSDAPPKKCPQCGGAVEQLPSAPAAHFKGEGWYVTDYARKGQAKPAEGGDGAKPPEKSDKPADKPETKSKSDTSKKPEKKK